MIPPFPEGDKRQHGYSRDKRSDCVQVVIALVGTPKGRLSRCEAQLLEQPWQTVRAGVQVKLLSEEGELYVLAQSKVRCSKRKSGADLFGPTTCLQPFELSNTLQLRKSG